MTSCDMTTKPDARTTLANATPETFRSEIEKISPEKPRTMDSSKMPTTETALTDLAVAANVTPVLTSIKKSTSLHAPEGGVEDQRGPAERTKRLMKPGPPPTAVSLPSRPPPSSRAA